MYNRKLAIKRARTTTATSLCDTDIIIRPLKTNSNDKLSTNV